MRRSRACPGMSCPMGFLLPSRRSSPQESTMLRISSLCAIAALSAGTSTSVTTSGDMAELADLAVPDLATPPDLTAPTCSDGIRNGSESDVDCGGTCSKCGTGRMCGGAGDCGSGVCAQGVCVEAACNDR